jgi:hypothetical protein
LEVGVEILAGRVETRRELLLAPDQVGISERGRPSRDAAGVVRSVEGLSAQGDRLRERPVDLELRDLPGAEHAAQSPATNASQLGNPVSS